MFYQGTQYNVPLDIYISDRHPTLPPSVFVRPTANMMIKANHRFVEIDGHVQIPYLVNWKPLSKLTELVQSLSAYFGEEPPLFSRPAGQVYQGSAATSVSRPFNQSRPPSGQSYNASSYPPTGTVVAMGAATMGAVTGSVNTLSSLVGGAAFGTNARGKREKLETDLSTKLQAELRTMYQKIGREIEEERKEQRLLQQSNHATVATRQTLEQLRLKYTAALQEVEQKSEELKQWAEEQSRRDPDDVESALEPFDQISSQLVRLNAEQQAAEDLIDCLEKALLNGAIDLPTMLKETRRLASQQFLARMHVMKINASLHQTLQNGM